MHLDIESVHDGTKAMEMQCLLPGIDHPTKSAGWKGKGAHFLKTSAAMGTVELTGLEMMATHALGQYLEMPSQSPWTMPAYPDDRCWQPSLIETDSPCCHRVDTP